MESQLDRPAKLPAAQVLIIDSSDDSREVLKTILASKGISTIAADRSANGLKLLESLEPAVTVLDLDCQDENTPVDDFVNATSQRNGSLVILGATKRDTEDNDSRHMIRKPYHYGPLIRKIEELVDRVHSD